MNEKRFLITYGLHGFVRHADDGGKSVFTIHGSENRKMVRHAAALISGHFGDRVDVQVA